MKKGSKSKPEEIIAILRSVEVLIGQGKTLDLACKATEITKQTYYRWRKEFGGMELSQAKELKKLQQENAKLKKIVADLSLEKLVWKEVAEGKY